NARTFPQSAGDRRPTSSDFASRRLAGRSAASVSPTPARTASLSPTAAIAGAHDEGSWAACLLPNPRAFRRRCGPPLRRADRDQALLAAELPAGFPRLRVELVTRNLARFLTMPD